jgi:hypothetical protein
MLTTYTGIDELVKATYFDFLEYEKVLFVQYSITSNSSFRSFIIISSYLDRLNDRQETIF